MHPPEPLTLNPEPSVPVIPILESVDSKPKTSKIKNLPTQIEKQKERRLVNDQQLLEQLRSKLNIHMIQSEPGPESDLNPEPESVLNPESSVLNHTSDGAEPITSASLLFLPVKMKSIEVHFMVDSGATNNFISHDLVQRLDLPTNRLKPPIHISFTDGRAQSIQRYCLVRVPFDPRYKLLLKFYVANIAHD